MGNHQQDANLEAVRRLCEEWPRLTREGFNQLLTADCEYINVPWLDRPRFGADAAYEALSRYQDGWRVDCQTLNIVARGDVVLTERLERFQRPGETTMTDLYVMGAFELKDGKIAKWRDYFDSAQAMAILA